MISAKFENAKPGDLFYESPTQYCLPRLLKFQKLEDGKVYFESLAVGREGEFAIPADDRYGYFPKLTKAKVQDVRRRIEDLKDELETYEYLVDQFNENLL